MPDIGAYLTPGAGDVNGDGKSDVLVVDSGAHLSAAFKNSLSGFTAQPSWVTELDAGSGAGGLAIVTLSGTSPPESTTSTPTTSGPVGNRAPVARVTAQPATGAAPLTVTLDASASTDADGDALSFTYDFGDGSTTPTVPATTTTLPTTPSDPATAIRNAKKAYDAADSTREGANKGKSIDIYLDAAHQFYVLTGVTATSPITAHNGSLKTIDKVSRYYLMKIGHDLGAVYLYNGVGTHGLTGCPRYETSYLYSLDATKQAQLGGFGGLPDANGTTPNLKDALAKLEDNGCATPAYTGAYNIVLTHITSEGSHDDGISIGYGAHDVTVQYSLFAGNTRSIFIKYQGVDRITLHHNWVMKQWIRGPLVNGAMVDYRNNIIEDWKMWGVRYESGSSGNVVNSLFSESSYAKSLGGKGTSALSFTTDGPTFASGNSYAGVAQATAGSNGSLGAPMDAPAMTTQSVDAMAPIVRSQAGATPRDATDNWYITVPTWNVSKTNPLRQ